MEPARPEDIFLGFFFADLSGQYLFWDAYFWIGSALTFLIAIMTTLAVTSENLNRETPSSKLDWNGTSTNSSQPDPVILCNYGQLTGSSGTEDDINLFQFRPRDPLSRCGFLS